MIAIAQIGGHQALISVGDIVEVDKLDAKVDEKITFQTLLTSDEDAKTFTLGTPFIDGVMVEAKVLEHTRGDKIRVFKMQPRKRYRKTLGHKQDYTLIEILSIGGSTAAPKKAAVAKTAEDKPKAKPAVTKKATPEKALAKKAPAAKKPAAKKPTAPKKADK